MYIYIYTYICIYTYIYIRMYIYRRFTFFHGENIFVYKRKFENSFYEILLLNEILVKYVSKY